MKSLVSHEGQYCANCTTPLVGEFCHECGQSVHSVLKPMHHMVEETMETVLHIDSRIVHTLPPLFLKPGFLTLEYFSGRRMRYIAPFRLMFVLSLLCFFVLHLTTSSAIDQGLSQHQQKVLSDRGSDFAQATSADEVQELLDKKLNALDAVETLGSDTMAATVSTDKQLLRTAANKRLVELHAQPLPASSASAPTVDRGETGESMRPLQIGWLPDFANRRLALMRQHFVDNVRDYRHGSPEVRQAAEDRMIGGVFGKLPAAMFVLVPVFALLLELFYVFKRRLYMEHLIVALHSHAFLFLWLLLYMLLYLLGVWLVPHAAWVDYPLRWLRTILLWWAPIYLLLMQKRIYRQGWPMTLLKYWCVGWFYFWLLLFVLISAVALGVAN
ncbi:DUF3667 domain-containing protein [Rhodanobacter sp. DHG33]|uniref:DUF3667 domain-containing protein n=1 Tax=Rhodanobacter sp. DHG33 TaxID=2775921 RepID=UPI001783D1BF|nr:DUF3667 domain-containing protein [Rhodanobacter sp. DHG33]MBD8899420.1 DUF3667 domain-containing protein [Rhodanobacter sp. DHG33]